MGVVRWRQFYGIRDLGARSSGRTVVNTFGNCLENFDIEHGSTTVVSVVLVFAVTDYALCPFGSRKLGGGRFGYPGDNLTGIKRENGGIRIDGVGMEYFREVHGFEDGFGKVWSERIFIRATKKNTNGTLAPTTMLRRPKKFVPGISPRLC